MLGVIPLGNNPKLTKYLIGWMMLGDSLSNILGLHNIIISGKNVI